MAAQSTAKLGPCRGPCVLLDADVSAVPAEGETNKPKWLQAAYEGRFKGHWMGEFEFTRKIFEQIVANFHGHPRYVAGAEQGTAEEIAASKFDLVQFDFHHASEMDPTNGDIAVTGAPAQGWVMDAAVRNGPDGKAQLWLYSRFLEPAATYLAEKRYKWVSVSVDFAGRDLVTNEPIGAVLTSIALTNRPFLQELPSIAAERVRASGYWYGVEVSSPDDAFEAIRRCLGLPETADVTAVAAEIAKLKQWAQPGATPPAGVDAGEHIAKFRSILSLPVLADEPAVFAELDKLFARLSGASPPAEGITVAASQRQEKPMSTPNSPAVDEEKARALQSLRAMLTQSLAPRLKVDAAAIADNKIVLEMEKGATAMDELAALLESLGASNVKDALLKVGEAKTLADKFNALMPQFNEMKAKVDEYETADTEQDVEMAMASQGWDPGDPQKANIRKLLTKERKANKSEFRKDYGITDEARRKAEADRAHLSVSIATQRQTAPQLGAAGPLANLSLSGGRVVQNQQSAPLFVDPIPGSDAVDVSGFAGSCLVQKAEAYVRSLNAQQPYDAVHMTAVELTRGKRVYARNVA